MICVVHICCIAYTPASADYMDGEQLCKGQIEIADRERCCNSLSVSDPPMDSAVFSNP